MFKAVIFDWDGTLADTRRVVVTSFQKALKEIQGTIDSEFIERRIGKGSAKTFREILQHLNVSFDEPLIQRLVKKKIEAEIEKGNEVKLFDGASHLLNVLYSKVKLGLASMNDYEVIDHLLRTMNVRRFFDAVLTADDVTYSKPHPEIFLKCAAKLDCKPEKCVVLEDSIFGVTAAKNAGMSCIAVLSGVYQRKELDKEKTDLIVNSLKQQKKILRFIFE